MAHEVETMAYAGAVPWHGLGVRVDAAMTSAEAISLAELDWEVKLVTAFAGDGPLTTPAEGFRAIQRQTDGKVFGFCTPNYKPIQNAEGFAFLDSLVEDGRMRFETAISLQGGRRVALLARLEEDWTVLGDRHVPYITVILHHDAEYAMRAFPTTVRVVCNNTAELAIASDARAGVIIRHAGDTKAALAEASKLLRVTTGQQRRYAAWMESLAAQRVTDKSFASVRTTLFGEVDEKTPAQRQHAIETFTAMYRAESDRQGENAYSLFEAVTGYANHGKRSRSEEGRFISLLNGGTASAVIRDGANVIDSIAKVKRSAITV